VQLTRLLHEAGNYQVHVACLSLDGVLLVEVERLGLGDIPEFPLTNFHNLNMALQIRRFIAVLSKLKIDVVHTHDFYTNIFGMIGAKLGRVAARIASRRETLGMHTQAQKRAERGAYRMAHVVVANAQAVRSQLIKEGVAAQKVITIYNGLDRKRFELPPGLSGERIREILQLPPNQNRPLITMVANLAHDIKDHPMFLRTAHRVRAAIPDTAFVIAGEGQLMDSMRALANQLELDDVFFIGRCNHIAELLAISEICVLTSKAEGFSNSILEYMAAARPVVATDVGGAREAIIEGQTGYLVPSGDDELMAKRIITLLLEPERARAMGEQGRRLVEEKFSCEAQLRQSEAVYDQLLANVRNAC
jgi:glycosyltransferase involved in cell wall biosynthesis